MFKRSLAPLCAVLLLAAPVAAQEMSPEEAAAMQAWMTYMTPGEAHQMLGQMTGEWSHTLKMWQAPGAPPMETTASSTGRTTMGGRYLVEDFSGNMMGMPFEGQAITGYDNALGKYFSIWIDNMGTGVMIGWGEHDGESNAIEFTGTYTDPMTGQEAPFRQVVTHMGEGHNMMEMFMVAPDGTEFKSMEIHSMKQAAGS